MTQNRDSFGSKEFCNVNLSFRYKEGNWGRQKILPSFLNGPSDLDFLVFLQDPIDFLGREKETTEKGLEIC